MTTIWATAPLLDPANVGKSVWFVWNGNLQTADVRRITKIGRTNVHLDRESLKVSGEGSTAYADRNGYMLSCHTEQWRLEMLREIAALIQPRMLAVMDLIKMARSSVPEETR